MKYTFYLASLLFLVISACESHKKSAITESGAEVVKVREPQLDTFNKSAEPAAQTKIVEGAITDINVGKDGYTATIKASDQSYHATISRANLDDPQTYKQFEKGTLLKVTGDYWKMGEEHHITVRTIN